MTDETLHTAVSADLKQEIRIEAARQEKSMSQLLREIIQERFDVPESSDND